MTSWLAVRILSVWRWDWHLTMGSVYVCTYEINEMSIRIASGKRNWPPRWKKFQRVLTRSLQGRVLFSFLAPTRTKKNLNKKRFIVHSHRNDDHHQALRHRPPRRPPGDPRHHPRRACRPRIRRLVRRSLDRLPPHVRRCRHRPNTRRHRGPRACLFLPLADTHTLPHKPPTATLTPPSRHRATTIDSASASAASTLPTSQTL